MIKLYVSLCFLISFHWLSAQSTYTISGYTKDVQTGETLFQTNIYNKAEITEGTTSNTYGFYSLTLPEGNYTLVFSYLGYTSKEIDIQLFRNEELNVSLEEGVTFKEVIVRAEEEEENVQSTAMGTVELPIENIKKLPALLGEVDILKALQLLPGVLSSGEGNAGFYVRGGGPDQNLILLDEAIVYNSGHMLGFFSVFNADAIKNTTLIKGGMPAFYGERVSSVVDIQMKEGNNRTFTAEGGIGLVASRLTIQGPIKKGQTSFMVSGRRTYAFDLAQPAIKKTEFAGTNYFFYDLNAKVNHRFSQKDRLYLSAYFGRDVLKYVSLQRGFTVNMPYGNATATLRWNHLFNSRLFMNISAIYNNYEFKFSGEQSDFTVDVYSGVRDYNFKADFDFFPTHRHTVKFGWHHTYHRLTPNIARATSGEVNFNTDIQAKYAHESAVYIQDDFKVNDRLSVHAGLRFSGFAHVGPYAYSEEEIASKGELVKTYWGLEPRLSGKLSLDKTASIKAGFSWNYQYVHLVSNSTSTLPIDVWVPSSPKIKPQLGLQYALGYFKNFKDDAYETSIEVYFKDLKNQIDYGENYIPNVTIEVEDEFVFGKGKAYGIELFLKKRKGSLNGWVGYTLARTDRTFPDIKNGETFPARFDRTHDVSLVLNYKLNRKWEFGAVFVYGTGNSYTPIKSLFLIEQDIHTEYGPRNSARIPSYHRLDLAATLTPDKKGKKWHSSWTFSIYNVYNRLNTYFTYPSLALDLEAGRTLSAYYKISLFPVIPSVTWNFKFGNNH